MLRPGRGNAQSRVIALPSVKIPVDANVVEGTSAARNRSRIVWITIRCECRLISSDARSSRFGRRLTHYFEVINPPTEVGIEGPRVLAAPQRFGLDYKFVLHCPECDLIIQFLLFGFELTRHLRYIVGTLGSPPNPGLCTSSLVDKPVQAIGQRLQ